MRTRFSVSLDERTVASLDEEASKMGLSRNDLISLILSSFIREKRKISVSVK